MFIQDCVPIYLPSTLEPIRDELRKTLREANLILQVFSRCYGWEDHLNPPFAHAVIIADSKPDFGHMVCRLMNIPEEKELPPTACAVLEKNILVVVSPSVYADIYPEGVEPHGYSRLMAHEMAHRLHIRILGGDEDAMGPIWFYEGFAIFAAGQFSQSLPELTPEAIRMIMKDPERGSYRNYATAFRYALCQYSIIELVHGKWSEVR